MRRLEVGGFFGAALLTAGIAGCSGPQDYYPLELGRSASYSVRTGFHNYVETLEPKRVVSVEGARGFEVDSALGASRLAWKGDVLVADRLANASLSPAVPLLAPKALDLVVNWSGTVSFPTGTEEATATLSQTKNSVSIGGRRFKTIKSTLILDTPKRQVALETDFAPDVGIVRQEQRTNNRFDLALELLAER